MSEETAVPILFDTNFFRAFTGKTTALDFQDRLKSTCEKSVIRVFDGTFAPWRTPFALLEWIGVRLDSIPRPSKYPALDLAISGEIDALFSHFFDHYQSCPELQSQQLRQHSMHQRTFIAASALPIWDAAVGGIFEAPGHMDWICTALAFDRIHNLQLPCSSDLAFYRLLIASGFFDNRPIVRDLSKFRLARRLWEISWSGLPAEIRSNLTAEHRCMSLKNHADYLDSDLVHIATLGVEPPGQPRQPAVCFTLDSPDTIKIRIGAYRGLVRFARRLHNKEATAAEYPSGYETCYNGIVYCFDSQGCFVKKIHVRSDTSPIRFLGEATIR